LTNPAKQNIITTIRGSNRRVADIKSEPRPASNRNRWPASYWNAWPASSESAVQLNIEPHPEDWVETLHPALDMIRVIGSKNVKFLYCAPHTFYFGADMGRMIRECGAQ
jgi:myo-inositol catabolism protein IolH